MRYYFPTSSLNADNILSTESISPKSFYKRRPFGYQNFYSLKSDRHDNCIFLYSQIPFYSIEDAERDNYPMIVEIDDAFVDIKPTLLAESDSCKIYVIDQSVHINPNGCRLLFFTDKARVLAKQSCSDSILNKLLDFYTFETINANQSITLERLANAVAITEESSCQNNFARDVNHNKAKGFVYGYYMGQLKSLSPNTSYLLKLQKRIYDIVASVVNNGGVSNTTFDEELAKLDAEYTKHDPTIEEVRLQWCNWLKQYGEVDKMEQFLKDIHKEAEIKKDFCNKRGFVIRKSLKEFGSWNLQDYSQSVSSHINSLIFQEHSNLMDCQLSRELDTNPDFDMTMLTSEDEDSSLYNKILSRIIWSGQVKSLDDLRVNRYDTATQVTRIIKEIIESLGRTWDNSPEQKYFHHLRQNIKDFTPFDPNETDSIVLKSLAAFLLKGEDYSALVNYMEDNSIYDYRYALSIWGAVLGYIGIPRNVFNSVIKKSILNDVYKDAYLTLYRKEFDGNLKSISENQRTLVSIDEKSTQGESIVIGKANEVMTLKDKVYYHLGMFEKENGKRTSAKNKESIEKALSITSDGTILSFLMHLNDFPGFTKISSKSFWTYLKDKECPEYDQITSLKSSSKKSPKKEQEQMPSFWDQLKETAISVTKDVSDGVSQLLGKDIQSQPNKTKSTSDLFIYDTDVCHFISSRSYLPSQIRETLYKKVGSFQKSYAIGGRNYNRIDCPTDNKSTIDHFKHWCFYDKGGYPPIVEGTPENKQYFEQLTQDLLNRYANR